MLNRCLALKPRNVEVLLTLVQVLAQSFNFRRRCRRISSHSANGPKMMRRPRADIGQIEILQTSDALFRARIPLELSE